MLLATRRITRPAVGVTPVQARTFGHGYPPSVTGIARTSNFGHFDTDISTHPAWYRFIFNFLYKIKFDVYYTNFMQYRRYGLHFEDILAETPAVAQALERVPGEVLSDRDDRLKQALVLHAAGDVLPKDNWATAATDKAYMAPYLIQTVQERRDREAFRPR